ncbi:hypothetical protein DN752_19700 [Echinicola strongylocentroti]|uniref:Uncharacterized protein n=1 Tax=Echinicola strongylocentroti TaxID=1795355 RepID=A0A2Z4INR1_9BACT|nr:hypothetical protein [Echinicola strongylocentroti]AWW32186.1 hypothetical protein DN752_19700 [Echinicola strongylocentroti]
MSSKLIIFTLGAIAAAAVMRIFFWPEITEREEVTYRTETKTDWIRKDTTIYHFQDSLRILEVERYREPSPEPEKYDSIRHYQGSDPHLYGRVNWKATTGGYLQHLEINPVLDIPIRTVTNTIERNTTKVMHPKGLYATGGISSYFKYSVGATYLNNKSLIGYEYTPQLDLHEIKVGFKVW